MPSFNGCSDYAEPFWNMIEGDKVVGEVYTHSVTEEDAKTYPTLIAGQTVHMMLSVFCSCYIVSEAVTDDFDDSELSSQVSKLRANGACCIIDGPRVAKFEECLRLVWSIDADFSYDPKCNKIQALQLAQFYKELLRDANRYFVDNSRVFTEDELKVIEDFKVAKKAYDRLFKKRR
jgi:hypothetical protein